MFLDRKVKPHKQQNTNANIKIIAKAGNRTGDLSHRSLVCYRSASETTEHIN